jgi:hypothetical protein
VPLEDPVHDTVIDHVEATGLKRDGREKRDTGKAEREEREGGGEGGRENMRTREHENTRKVNKHIRMSILPEMCKIFIILSPRHPFPPPPASPCVYIITRI